jgi:hypothetical protein
MTNMINSQKFDIFLSHNSKDKGTVRSLARALESQGIRVWLDEEQLIPGKPWQEALEKVLQDVNSAAILIGNDGLGPWETPEMRVCLLEFVSRELPVIPILLPGAPEKPDIPAFLKLFTWVDLREGLTEVGITRIKSGVLGVAPVAMLTLPSMAGNVTATTISSESETTRKLIVKLMNQLFRYALKEFIKSLEVKNM